MCKVVRHGSSSKDTSLFPGLAGNISTSPAPQSGACSADCVGSSSNAYAQKYFNMSGRWSFVQPTLLGERRSDKPTDATTYRKFRRTMERHRQSRRRAHRTGIHRFHPRLWPGAQGVELRGPPGASPCPHRFPDARRVDRRRLHHHLRHRQFP